MRKLSFDNNIKIVATRKQGSKTKIDFYIQAGSQKMIYAFTRKYSNRTWDLCKSGISVKELAGTKSKDTRVMQLVKYLKYIMPYLYEEYDLAAV